MSQLPSSATSPTSPKPRRRRLLPGILLAAALAPLVAVAVALLAQSAWSWRQMAGTPPPGRLVDVGGFRMHLRCEGSGSPTVLFESGMGGYSLDWELVFPAVSRRTRACAYDRAGLGWSETGPAPRTAARIADELETLLERAGERGPFLVVAHSFGGFPARVFAARNRAGLAGLVLLDTSHEDQLERMPAVLKELMAAGDEELRAAGRWMPLGLPRYRGQCGLAMPQYSATAAARIALECRRSFFDALLAEIDGFEQSGREAAGAGGIGDAPLSVVMHDPARMRGVPPEVADVWQRTFEEMQADLLSLSTRGDLVVAAGSGHYIHAQRPDLVVETIERLVALTGAR